MQKNFRQHAVLFVSIFIVAGLFTACSKKMKHDTAIRESLVEMRAMAAKLGEPTSIDNILYFGKMKINENFEIVDAIQAKYGCTATFFEKQGDKFVRVSTDVMHDGKRAVGTILDPDGPVIIKIRRGKAFYGTVDILGDLYETGYEPIKNCDGEIIGIYYTGFQLKK